MWPLCRTFLWRGPFVLAYPRYVKWHPFLLLTLSYPVCSAPVPAVHLRPMAGVCRKLNLFTDAECEF